MHINIFCLWTFVFIHISWFLYLKSCYMILWSFVFCLSLLSLIFCLGSWFLALGSWFFNLGSWFLALLSLIFCLWSFVFDLLSLIFCLGSWLLVLGSWLFVLFQPTKNVAINSIIRISLWMKETSGNNTRRWNHFAANHFFNCVVEWQGGFSNQQRWEVVMFFPESENGYKAT